MFCVTYNKYQKLHLCLKAHRFKTWWFLDDDYISSKISVNEKVFLHIIKAMHFN